MKSYEVIPILQERIYIKGKPIEKSELFVTLSDMNVSDQSLSDYSNGLHNLLKNKGSEEAAKKALTIFRINPLAAVKIIESCILVRNMADYAYSIKPIVMALNGSFDKSILLNKNKAPYVTLLIEAVFQESVYWEYDMFLEYAKNEDQVLHDNGQKAKYLNAYNIKHILKHIPENRQIELINWFWDKHCYAVLHYRKTSTYSGRRVDIIMNELVEGSLWQHLENAKKRTMSESEAERDEKERSEIKKFLQSVVEEERHMQYVKIVIGSNNFYEKLQALMGKRFVDLYDEKVEKQIQIKEAK